MNIRLLAVFFVLLSLVSFACSGGRGDDPVCEPGAQETEACEIEPLLECTRTCLDDGSAWGACQGCPEVHPCEGVDCGGFGTCEIFGSDAVCNCESGYLPDGLDCKPKDCTPSCDGKDCGSDGCDGTCGACDPTQDCTDGNCVCAPQCDGKACGDDSCGGSCGDCAAGETCQADACVSCEADCWGKECGDDGCGGSCGDCGGELCQDGLCVCAPECNGKACGDDGCGGSCGDCPPGQNCDDGVCVACVPSCAGKVCGDDGCGGTCGQCPQGMNCSGGQCVSQGSSCVGFCGGMAPDYCYCDDACFGAGDCCPDVCEACPDLPGCGGGTCDPGEMIDCWGQCSPEYLLGDGVCDDAFDCEMFMFDFGDCGGGVGSCEGMCGGSAGMCHCDEYCFEAGDCCPDVCDFCPMYLQCGCEPNCEGKECGNDGCFGSCGACPPGFGCNAAFQCEEGLCEWEGDIPDCNGVCAPAYWVGDGFCDGGEWGGTNFNCEEFDWDGGDCAPCVPSCEGKECGSDGCFGSCGDCAEGMFCVGYQCSADAMTCGDFYACIISCDEDYNCQDACMAAAPEEAMIQFDAIGICLEAAGYFDCIPEDQDCIDAAMAQCQAEVDACFQPDLDCPAMTACMFDCPVGDSGCTALCYWKGTNAAQDMYSAMTDCILAVCGDDPTEECWDQAIAGDCLDEFTACGLEPCEPDCTDKECGDDGCDGICGECGENQMCSDAYECVCLFVECGDVCCDEGETCVDGECVLADYPQCEGAMCGADDGVGGLCDGPCPGDNEICSLFECVCEFEECEDVCCDEVESCVDGECTLP